MGKIIVLFTRVTHSFYCLKFLSHLDIKRLYKEKGDEGLIDLLRKGDRKAWNFIIEEYYDGLLIYIICITKEKETAEEILQDVFMNFWSKREQLNIIVSIKAYIYRSARNTAINHIKRKKFERDYHKGLEKTANWRKNLTEETFNYTQLEKLLYQAIEELPDLTKEIFRLSRFSAMSYKEIADTLQVPVRTVHYQIGLALKKLRQILKQKYDFDLMV